MAEYLGEKLGEWFYKKGIIESNQIDDIRFGFETICSEILEFFVILFVGFSTNSYLETIIYIILFRELREIIKGYHAKTIWRCFFLTVGTYVLTMYTYPYLNSTTALILMILSLPILCLYFKYHYELNSIYIFVMLHVVGFGLLFLKYSSYLQILLLLDLIVSASWLPERRKNV